MNLKTKDNSADVSCSEDILNTTESLPNKDKDWQFYLILIEKTNRPFQSPQDHTNNRINRRIFLDWIRDKQYISLFEDKKNREGFSFASAALPPAFDKHPNLPISEEFPNWTENFLELESNKRLQLVSNETIKRIKEFKLLKEGWDSYNAKPIKWATIIRAIDFFTKVISKHHNAPYLLLLLYVMEEFILNGKYALKY